MVDYSGIPVPYMVDSLRDYIQEGELPGDFLTAVLQNDLSKAVDRADMNNRQHLSDWVV